MRPIARPARPYAPPVVERLPAVWANEPVRHLIRASIRAQARDTIVATALLSNHRSTHHVPDLPVSTAGAPGCRVCSVVLIEALRDTAQTLCRQDRVARCRDKH